MKLVAWLGGPELMETNMFPGEFVAPIMTIKQWATFWSTLEGDWDDMDVFIPLEVDE